MTAAASSASARHLGAGGPPAAPAGSTCAPRRRGAARRERGPVGVEDDGLAARRPHVETDQELGHVVRPSARSARHLTRCRESLLFDGFHLVYRCVSLGSLSRTAAAIPASEELRPCHWCRHGSSSTTPGAAAAASRAFNVITLEHAEAIVAGAEAAAPAGDPADLRERRALPPRQRAPDQRRRGRGRRGSRRAGRAAPGPRRGPGPAARRPPRRASPRSCSTPRSCRTTRTSGPPRAAATGRTSTGLWLEAELGEVGGKDGAHAPGVRTDPAEAARYVERDRRRRPRGRGGQLARHDRPHRAARPRAHRRAARRRAGAAGAARLVRRRRRRAGPRRRARASSRSTSARSSTWRSPAPSAPGLRTTRPSSTRASTSRRPATRSRPWSPGWSPHCSREARCNRQPLDGLAIDLTQRVTARTERCLRLPEWRSGSATAL